MDCIYRAVSYRPSVRLYPNMVIVLLFVFVLSKAGLINSLPENLHEVVNFLANSNEIDIDVFILENLVTDDETMEMAKDIMIPCTKNFYFSSQMPSSLKQEKRGNKSCDERVLNEMVIRKDESLDTFLSSLQSQSASDLSKKITLSILNDDDEDRRTVQEEILEKFKQLPNLQFNSLVFMLVNQVLFEVYRTNKLVISAIDIDSELRQDIWERRGDLYGLHFKVVYAVNAPYVFNMSASNELFGSNVDVARILAQVLNFTISFHQVADGKFGTLNEDNVTWNGVIGEIVNGDADFSIADIAVTESRAAAVDFTDDIFHYRNRFYMKRPSPEWNFTTFLEAFHLNFWLVSGLFYILLSIAFMASAKCLENEDVDYATSLVSMGLALMCLDVKQNPSRLTTRMVLLNIGLTGAFLFWFYNAIFISYLTVDEIEVPIDKLEDLLSQSQYQVFVKTATSHESFFKEATKAFDPVAHQIWTTTMVNNSQAFFDGDTKIAEQIILDNDKMVFFSQEMSTELMMKGFPCNITRSKSSYLKLPMGFAFPKNSPYLPVINHRISVLRESGQLDLVFGRRRRVETTCGGQGNFKEIGYPNIFTAFLVLVVGIFLGIFMASVEAAKTYLYDDKHNDLNEEIKQ